MKPFVLAGLFLLAVSVPAQASPRAETFRMGFNGDRLGGLTRELARG